MFRTFYSVVLDLLVHFEGDFRIFKTSHPLKKPITEANHQNLPPPQMSSPLSGCWKKEVPGAQPSSNPGFNGLQQKGEMEWHEGMINEKPHCPLSWASSLSVAQDKTCLNKTDAYSLSSE